MSRINQKPVPLTEEGSVFALADKAVYDSLESGSFDFAAEVISSYRSLSRASELAVSRVLHGVNSYWLSAENKEKDDFFQWSIRATGYNLLTIERHLGVWEMLENYAPDSLIHSLRTHTIRQLFKIYSLVVVPRKTLWNYEFVSQDYDISREDWVKLAEAQDEHRVAEIVSDIKNKPRNKNFMSLKIDSRGDVWVFQGQEAERVGQLFVESGSRLVQKAVSRITDRSGITPKDEY